MMGKGENKDLKMLIQTKGDTQLILPNNTAKKQKKRDIVRHPLYFAISINCCPSTAFFIFLQMKECLLGCYAILSLSMKMTLVSASS